MIVPAHAESLAQAVHQLAAGELVVMPTETVYGLGADASSEQAVARIYALKGRPSGHPLIVHVHDAEQARDWAPLDARAQTLMRAFWPGPLTLVLPRRPQAPAWACGGQPSVALRCPAHPVAQALLAAWAARGGLGIAAPSANRFGRISPTRAQHVLDDLGPDAPLILDGGSAEIGVESTILDLTRAWPVLLRPGRIAPAALAQALGEPLHGPDAAAPRVSGALAAHYQPRTPVEVWPEAELPARIQTLHADRVAVWSKAPPPVAGLGHWCAMPADAQACEHILYDTLRQIDALGAARILVAAPPPDPAWDALRDRLGRAAGPRPA